MKQYAFVFICFLSLLISRNAQSLSMHWIVEPETIQFEPKGTKLVPSSLPDLEKIAKFLKDNPFHSLITLEGHTDSKEAPGEDSTLSSRRAQVVMDSLIALGIEPSRLQVEAYGATRPIADNERKEGRAKNRRVEVKIVESSGFEFGIYWPDWKHFLENPLSQESLSKLAEIFAVSYFNLDDANTVFNGKHIQKGTSLSGQNAIETTISQITSVTVDVVKDTRILAMDLSFKEPVPVDLNEFKMEYGSYRRSIPKTNGLEEYRFKFPKDKLEALNRKKGPVGPMSLEGIYWKNPIIILRAKPKTAPLAQVVEVRLERTPIE